MRHALGTILVAFMMVTAGCSGFLNGGTTNGEGQTESTATESTPTNSSPGTPTPSPIEREYLTSGKEFTRLVGIRLQQVHGVRAEDRSFFRNNTVSITYRLNEGTPLYKSVMNVTQVVSVIVGAKTTSDEAEAMQNGPSGIIHRPEMVYVHIIEPGGNRVGSFRINPATAFEYRTRQLRSEVFASNVIDTLELEQEFERGPRSPSWYLNRSQLSDWVRSYRPILQNESDPASTDFDAKIPVEEVTIHPENMRVRHEVRWMPAEMGGSAGNAVNAMADAYWKATNRSWAMAPSNLTMYIDQPGYADVRARQNLGWVYWLLTRPKNDTNIRTYRVAIKSEIIRDE